MKKAGIITLLTVMVILTLSGCSGSSEEESSSEMADLQGMRGAELTAMQEWKDKLPDEPVEYWYNPDTFELIPISEPKPDSLGLGKKGEGGAVDDFEADTGMSYEYDESKDYTDKVIHVTVSNSDGELDIKVDWVDAE